MSFETGAPPPPDHQPVKVQPVEIVGSHDVGPARPAKQFDATTAILPGAAAGHHELTGCEVPSPPRRTDPVFERFTDAGPALRRPRRETARDLGHGSITVVHLFVGARQRAAGDRRTTPLEARGVTAEQLRRAVEEVLPPERSTVPPRGTSRSARRRRRAWSCRCGSRWNAATTRSSRGTSCWPRWTTRPRLDAVLTAAGPPSRCAPTWSAGLPPVVPRRLMQTGQRHRSRSGSRRCWPTCWRGWSGSSGGWTST